MKATSNTPNFKERFASAKTSGVTVLECNGMDDYFQMTSIEIHCHLSDYAEFAIRSMNAGDLVAMEEVEQQVANLNAFVAAMNTRVHNMKLAMLTVRDAKKSLDIATHHMNHKGDCLGELFECELGMKVDASE